MKIDSRLSTTTVQKAQKMAKMSDCSLDELVSAALDELEITTRLQAVQREFGRAGRKAGIRSQKDVDAMIHAYRSQSSKRTRRS